MRLPFPSVATREPHTAGFMLGRVSVTRTYRNHLTWALKLQDVRCPKCPPHRVQPTVPATDLKALAIVGEFLADAAGVGR
jgi:hypothetical protein